MKPATRLMMADEIRWDPEIFEERPELADPLVMTEAETWAYVKVLQQVSGTLREIIQRLMQALADKNAQTRVLEQRLRHAHVRILELERGSLEQSSAR